MAASTTLIPAIEISSLAGHIIGLWVERLIPRDLSAEETIAEGPGGREDFGVEERVFDGRRSRG